MHSVAALFAAVTGSVADVSLLALTVALALHVGKLLAEARSWHWILRHAHDGSGPGFRITMGAFVGSIGANAVLPARVGQALRVGVVKKRVPGSSVVTIVATILLETAIEVVFGVVVIVVVIVAGRRLSSGSGPLRGVPSSPLVLAVAGAVVIVAGLVAYRFRRPARTLLRRMGQGFSIVTAPRSFVSGVLSWKLAAWVLRLGAVYAFLVAFHIPAAPWTAVVVVAAQNVAGAVPLLPGNAGTQQAAIGLALAGSASAGDLLGFGLGMQASTAITDIVLGAAALALVAGRDDLRGALRALRPRRRSSADPAISTAPS